MKAIRVSLIAFLLLGRSAFAQQSRDVIPQNLFGSVPQGIATAGTTPLSIADCIDRALKYNLGPIVSAEETRVSRAARVRALSELLPTVTASISGSVQQINLAAFGFHGFPGQPLIAGPFSVFDARARYSQTVIDFKLLHELRSASEKIAASNYAQQDVRELVVLVAADLYLDAVAAASRVEAARAQLKTAQAVYDRARNLRESGVVPGIDVLRAQVQFEAQQQRVLAAENDHAKRKLNLARAIGLPQSQAFTQTDGFIASTASVPEFQEALENALASRFDYQRSLALVRGAEEAVKAAAGRGRPSVQVSADYGAIGRTPFFSHGTVGVQGSLVIPLYTGERVRAELMESEGFLEQRKAESANLRERIEYEIRAASLDIQSASEQLRVAEGARTLAQQQLVQAQDRFAAGVANGLEVTQAQQAVADAEENRISSIYALNIAQASLARAMGAAEKTIKSFFGGK